MMGNGETILFGLTAFTLMLSFLIPTAGYPACTSSSQVSGCIPNVTNPWTELTGGLGIQTPSLSSGTVTQTQKTENIQQTAAAKGCTLGLIGGVLAVGAGVAFAVATGGLGTPVAIGAVVLAGGAGCLIGAAIGNSYSGPVTQAFSNLVAATGPLGQFVQALTVALTYAQPFVSFVLDWVPYSFALMSYEPAAAGLLFPFVILTIVWWIAWLAKLFRGSGMAG